MARPEEAELAGGGLTAGGDGQETLLDGRPRPRVLVVDDEESITDLVATALRYEGFQVEVARSGRGALRAATSFRPPLVVLDVMLPDLDGFEVQRQLAADRLRVPILFLTARDRGRAARDGERAGGAAASPPSERGLAIHSRVQARSQLPPRQRPHTETTAWEGVTDG